MCLACQPGYRCPEASISATPPGSECPEGTYCNPARTLTECPAGTYGEILTRKRGTVDREIMWSRFQSKRYL